jgi:hypothetical protein
MKNPVRNVQEQSRTPPRSTKWKVALVITFCQIHVFDIFIFDIFTFSLFISLSVNQVIFFNIKDIRSSFNHKAIQQNIKEKIW